ncbi:hypothetical protein KSP40_PGU020646 [Platanthera guangdongensis]|uniref:Pyruvate carboxyltransferase domain-containing protein n=1 Tax=Platanthera guangdongensis TaxID=2320717 RepID=A0ABR2LQV0_9ASPA
MLLSIVMAIYFVSLKPKLLGPAVGAVAGSNCAISHLYSLTLQSNRLNAISSSDVFQHGSAFSLRSFTARCSLVSRSEYFPSTFLTLTSNEKLVTARLLFRLGVDIIEAGFPPSSPDDLEVVCSIAIEVGNNPAEDGHCPGSNSFQTNRLKGNSKTIGTINYCFTRSLYLVLQSLLLNIPVDKEEFTAGSGEGLDYKAGCDEGKCGIQSMGIVDGSKIIESKGGALGPNGSGIRTIREEGERWRK